MATIFKKYLFALGLALALAGCAKEQTKETMQADELAKKATSYADKKKYEEACSYLEELIARFPDNPNISNYKIMLAELYFKDEKFEPAQILYDHFNQFYPADKQAEYSKYRSILSKFYQTLKTDCDQSDTEDAIKLCDEYVQNTSFKKYRKEILDIQHTCESRLIDKEVYVFNFYVRDGKYDAARNRLKFLKDKYLANNPALEARLLFLECKLAQKEKDSTTVKQKLDALTTKYPESQFTQMAQGLNTRAPFIF
jgi:outer membrane assembly lipoprotein YfiO